MAEALYLVSKANSDSPSNTIINDIHCVLINADDGGSDADTIADAEAQVIAGGHPIPSGYFDTVQDLELTAGPLKDDLDTFIILRRTIQTVQGP